MFIEFLTTFIEVVTTHSSMKICVYLPKREELSLRTVLAFPKDSNRGVASRIWPITIDRNVTMATFNRYGMVVVKAKTRGGTLYLYLVGDGREEKRRKESNNSVSLNYHSMDCICQHMHAWYTVYVPVVWRCICDVWLSSNAGSV